MSSFINKSGKKVAPKGAPRRRAGGPSAATPAAPQPSTQPAIEKSQETLQSSQAVVQDSNTLVQLPTANATQVEKPPAASAPVVLASPQTIRPYEIQPDPTQSIQSSSNQQSRSQVPTHEISAPKESIAIVTPETLQTVAKTPKAVSETPKAISKTLTVVAPSTRRRSISPLVADDESRAIKRRRLEEVVDVVQESRTAPIPVRVPSLSPRISRRTLPNPENGRAPVAVMLPGPIMHPVPKPTIPESQETKKAESVPEVEQSVPRCGPRYIPTQVTSVESPNSLPVSQTSSLPLQPDLPNAERLVSYQTPPAGSSRAGLLSSSSHPAKAARPAQTAVASKSIDKALTTRTKGARKDQWQVSTPTDVTTGKGKRKSRKPADRIQIELQQEGENNDDLSQPSVVTLAPDVTPVTSAPGKARKVRKDKGVKRTSKGSQTEPASRSSETPDGAANREATESETQATEPVTEAQKNPTPISEAAQKRLANAQKRKAKQLAKSAALSKATGRATAAIIDNAVAHSVEGRAGSSSRAKTGPTFIVTPGTPDREDTVATGRASVAATEMTEGGTVVQPKKRQRRAETPEENEAVFIVESQTNMFDLAGRDTENRVGFKSEREKAMRLINWDEVKAKRKAEDERMARMARSKRGQEDDYDPEEEGMDEDQRLARAVARNKHKRPGLQITLMANGEHVIDEQSQMVDRQRLNEDELELLEEVEEDDLTKKFNVQTYGLWRRKEEEERIPHNERWTFDQTEKFYDALTSFGTDFMIISTMFPGMTRRQIKAKFVREERQEPERIRDALTGHNSGRRNGVEGSGWDLKVYCEGAGLSESAFLDPKKIKEELERDRLEKEKEIEAARAEAAEEDRQRKLAGALNGADELDSDGEPLSPGAIVKRAREEARKKKLARLGEKKRKIMEMAGGSEEVVESIEDD